MSPEDKILTLLLRDVRVPIRRRHADRASQDQGDPVMSPEDKILTTLIRDLRIMQGAEDERNGDAAPQTARQAAEMIESLSVRLYWAERNLASALDALKWPQGEDRSSEPPIHSVVISVCGERAGKSLWIDYAISPRTIESAKFDVFRHAYAHLCRKMADAIARPEETKP